MWKPVSRQLATIGIIAVLYLAFAASVSNAYYQTILSSIPIWACLAVAWNLFSGYTGLTSFGHSAFFGLGAFVITVLQIQFGITPWVGLGIALALGAGAAVLIGIPTFRLRGHYFALAMLAYPLCLMYVFEWLGYTELSIPIRRDNPVAFMQFAQPYAYTVLTTVAVAACLVISVFVERSRWGLMLQAIKQDEMAARAAGINPFGWKMVMLMISGALASFAGALYVSVLLVTTPREVFGVFVSASAIIFTMFGGVGSIWGPLIGVAVLVPLGETLHAELGHHFPGLNGMVYGLAIILVMRWMPEGVFWRIYDRRRKGAAKEGAPASQAAAAPVAQPEIAGAALEVKGLNRAFGPIVVAKDFNFRIEAGSITGIVGPNGAGKTTLFNMINGYLTPDSGDILFDGQSLIGLPVHKRAERGFGRTFQVARVYSRLSVFDNVLAGAAAATQDMDEARSRALWACEVAELGGKLDAAASGVSAYDVRLIEIARALAARPRLLLLDETLAGLSTDEAFEVVRVVRKLNRLGITIVIIEHTMAAMVDLVERMVVLDRGIVIADGKPREVLKDKGVITAYLGPKWTERAEG
ncbi:MAG: ATP-binding cassette domain-containing protein [Aquamicrobium sp.]|uniref:branched-chain amino acid ABC transporter ATP-binding protein/permease n=1 Tax=Aquamicrobium sp. TaxID=1872579 RepID=UPI00349E8301|nr:ATP-binding cassette domain-containing protein [Aquamicrobium sp.]MCO5159262.1 ATP-binding cassette domain-containing protein [Aquamicrobium sp.]